MKPSTTQPATVAEPLPEAEPVVSADAVLYSEDFEGVEVGSIPDDFMVLEGEFAVREQGGNSVLHLPGQPLSTFSVLVGPSVTDNVAIRAKIHSGATRRRFNAFGVGLGGVAGVQVLLEPAKEKLTLSVEEAFVADVPAEWSPTSWTQFHLEVVKTAEEKWQIRGKVWPAEADEPAEWHITHDLAEEPLTGQPSLWGIPYAGKDIEFDDVEVRSLN